MTREGQGRVRDHKGMGSPSGLVGKSLGGVSGRHRREGNTRKTWTFKAKSGNYVYSRLCIGVRLQ